MPRLRDTEQALRHASNLSRQPYICRKCRAQAVRQFHSSPSSSALPFMKQIRESLFGTAESKEAKEKREETIQKKDQEQAKRDAARPALETKKDARGKKYEVAATIDPFVNPEYVVSSNWDGLRRIGGERWIKEQRDPGQKYVGFMPEKRMKLNDEQWQRLLHHITVEALALEAAGRDLNNLFLTRSRTDGYKATSQTSIIPDDTIGLASLQFRSAQLQEKILSQIPEAKPQITPAKTTETEDGTEESAVQEATESDSASHPLTVEVLGPITHSIKLKQYGAEMAWMNLRLKNSPVKLAIIKRIMQLTGHRVPDLAMSNATTLRDLYMTLKTKQPAKKLANNPELRRLKEEIPNVAVHATRRTPIHKEKEVGRWKIIRDELIARDLPVTGSRFVDAKPRIGVPVPKHTHRHGSLNMPRSR